MLNEIQKKILQTVADMAAIPTGAVNIRSAVARWVRRAIEEFCILMLSVSHKIETYQGVLIYLSWVVAFMGNCFFIWKG